ncbi:LysR substrate-binding domain-containing protein [Pseudomonas sp. D2002]|uniref:LysR substrate-binding domain-containing protein n=1 Tax=Pseudomonas sp. D2002 TaxID=2726980 RepID=UPI003529A960
MRQNPEHDHRQHRPHTWALAGQGIAYKTIWDAAADIRAGRLKVLLPKFCVREAGVYAVLHGNRYRVTRVRVLLDFLTEHFGRATEELLLDLEVPRVGRL